jgi:hypothetical protein
MLLLWIETGVGPVVLLLVCACGRELGLTDWAFFTLQLASNYTVKLGGAEVEVVGCMSVMVEKRSGQINKAVKSQASCDYIIEGS